ncbi:substrate-binding domain-containing protein [Salinibacterium sp. CAN_S4]|uniref:substrate-binding domain-containing protein n=1 Tax=Salinibacterium sp. CAN_S4 TaxID=2787727 RepID=UPI002FF34684
MSARFLATNRSHRIAALTSDLVSAGPSQTLQGLAQAARESGYLVDIISIDLEIPTSLTEALAILRRQEFAAIVVIAVTDDVRDAVAGLDFGVPLYVDSGPADLSSAAGDSFNAQGIGLTVEHLVSLGHRSIVHLAGPQHWIAARNRATAFEAAMASRGMPASPHVYGDWTARSGKSAISARALDPAVTAIVAANDQMALGALRAFTMDGISVPADMSITGFDDIPEAEFFTPPLTTIRIDFSRQGTFLFDSVLASITDADAPDRDEFMHPELIVRDSTAPPRP